MLPLRCVTLTLLVSTLFVPSVVAQEPGSARAAQAYRRNGQPVEPMSDTTLVAEAEEFRPEGPGWQAQNWGTNYFAATFANSFLSRKAYLGAPEQGTRAVASIMVKVPKAGRYLALVRYESVYRFETQFRVQVEQNGQTKLDRLYGARKNLKVWAFHKKLQSELAWDWGAVENVVWEGHDAAVELAAGIATLRLIADKQPEPTARRNVDLVMLTSDAEQVKTRIDKENYLPLDGMLTQAGDVHLKLHVAPSSPAMTLTVPNGTEHSPYWIHIRSWKPKSITAKPGESTDWVEVGSLLDTLNDGQWKLDAKATGTPQFSLEFGVRDAAGKIESVRRFDGLTGDVGLAYDADMRWSRRIRRDDEVLHDLVAYLKKQPVAGTPPKRTLVYGYTFDPRPADAQYTAAREEFIRLMGATALVRSLDDDTEGTGGLLRGYIDVRGVPTNKLEEHCRKLEAEGRAKKIAVVSLGDEIGLAAPPANDHAAFRAWLKTRGLKPSSIDPAAGDDWEKVQYLPTQGTPKEKFEQHYLSAIYRYRYGIRQLAERTEILRRHLPNAGIGANFSPHHGHLYLGPTHQWISLFRENGMTMPWGEDYIWQVPVGTQQMNFLMLDMFRAGVRHKPEAKIHYYVMPHTPGNTIASWRRQFYGDLAHGAKVLNLFEFRPVQAAYTENHCSDPLMYQEIRRCLHELGRFEDFVQDGQVRPGVAGLWFSEAADVWGDYASPYDAGKRSLYIAIRHQQLPLDAVLEGDDLSSYKVLYVTDQHVSRAASQAMARWVESGVRLVATAGAGMFDEYHQPNNVLRELLGAEPEKLEAGSPTVVREKEDLPFAQVLDRVRFRDGEIPVVALKAPLLVRGAEVRGTFGNGAAAVTVRKVGKGEAWCCGFLPGLSYFKPAIPLRPVDRGSTDDTMAHFIPTAFDRTTAQLVGAPAEGVERPVVCSQPLVETTVIQSKHGTLIPVVNWSSGPVKGLRVTLNVDVPGTKAELASGGIVQASNENGKRVLTLDLDVADALMLR